MTDRRLPPSGLTGTAAQIATPVANLCRDPGGALDRQLLMGTQVTIWHRADGWAHLSSAENGFTGYVAEADLCDPTAPDVTVTTGQSHAYTAPDLKSGARIALPFGARLTKLGETDGFIETPPGHIPRQHLQPRTPDPVEIARLFLGVPYLWGGNSFWGIDCSGLVHAAFHACGLTLPGDSDQQEQLGEPADLARGTVVFWPGHVGLMTDAQTLIHANAHAMAVTEEPLSDVIARADHPISAKKRFTLPRG